MTDLTWAVLAAIVFLCLCYVALCAANGHDL